MARLRQVAADDDPRKVLVIDDDAPYARSLVRLLGVAGCLARSETDAVAGVAAAVEWRPDVVLIDYFMPQLTGDEVVARIRAFDPLVPCLVVTGYAGSHGADLLRNPDVQAVHSKGDSPAGLVAWVRVWADAHRAARALDGGALTPRAAIDLLGALCRVPAGRRFAEALARFAVAAGAGEGAAAMAATPSGLVLGATGAYADRRSTEGAALPELAARDDAAYWADGHVVVRCASGFGVVRAPDPGPDRLAALASYRVVFDALRAASAAPDAFGAAPWGST